jgi:hypothetical protein
MKALDAAIEDAVASKTYTDVTQALPTCIHTGRIMGRGHRA